MGARTVLVVDDDPLQARGLARLLGEYDVRVATSGVEAWRILSSGERIDAVICDVMMPDVDGPALFERVGPAGPPFLFVTGCPYLPHVIAFLRGRGIRWLEKPLDDDVVRARVREILGADAARAPAV